MLSLKLRQPFTLVTHVPFSSLAEEILNEPHGNQEVWCLTDIHCVFAMTLIDVPMVLQLIYGGENIGFPS